jgi:hypothetical protein
MQLDALQTIVQGVDSLAQIENEHPLLGKQLKRFIVEIQSCCEEAYGRLSQTLGVVRQISDKPSEREIGQLTAAISDLPNSDWFKYVSRICDRLQVLANTFSEKIIAQREYVANTGGRKGHDLSMFLMVLSQHEGDLKEDMRHVVWSLQNEIGKAKTKGDFSDVRALAVDIQKQIDTRIDEISKVSGRMKGTSLSGAEDLLDKEVAEKALQTPERMLILSMFFLAFIFSLGAFAFHFLKAYQFVLVTGFALTAVIVVNAFYLRTIDRLSEKGFLSLMQLALLKFFAPLARRTAS